MFFWRWYLILSGPKNALYRAVCLDANHTNHLFSINIPSKNWSLISHLHQVELDTHWRSPIWRMTLSHIVHTDFTMRSFGLDQKSSCGSSGFLGKTWSDYYYHPNFCCFGVIRFVLPTVLRCRIDWSELSWKINSKSFALVDPSLMSIMTISLQRISRKLKTSAQVCATLPAPNYGYFAHILYLIFNMNISC